MRLFDLKTERKYQLIRGITDIIKENIEYFPRISKFSFLSIKKSNKNSDLGYLWLFIRPLMYVMMFYIAIALGFKNSRNIDGIEVPYLIWLASGIFAWFFLSTYAVGNATCFSKYKNYFKRDRIPVSVIPTIPIMTGLYIHIGVVIMLIIMCFFFKVKPDIHWIQLPFYTFFMALFAYVWSLLTGLITAITVDFNNILHSIRPAFFWLSGIFFNSRTNSNQSLFYFNPISFCVEGYRNTFCYHIWFWEEPQRFGGFCVSMLILTTLAVLLYRRVRRSIPEFI